MRFRSLSLSAGIQSLGFSLGVISSRKPFQHLNAGLDAPSTVGERLLICSSPQKTGSLLRTKAIFVIEIPHQRVPQTASGTKQALKYLFVG